MTDWLYVSKLDRQLQQAQNAFTEAALAASRGQTAEALLAGAYGILKLAEADRDQSALAAVVEVLRKRRS